MIEARQILQISVRRRERDRDGGRRHGLFERDGDPFRGDAVRIDHFADGHRELSAFGGDGRLDGAFTIIRKIFLSRELVNGLRRDEACLERLRRIEGDIVADGDGRNRPVKCERAAERFQRWGVQIGVFDVRDNHVLFVGKFRGDECSKGFGASRLQFSRDDRYHVAVGIQHLALVAVFGECLFRIGLAARIQKILLAVQDDGERTDVVVVVFFTVVARLERRSETADGVRCRTADVDSRVFEERSRREDADLRQIVDRIKMVVKAMEGGGCE